MLFAPSVGPMETPEEERHDYDPAPESETPGGATGGDGGEGNDIPEGLDSQQGGAGGDSEGTETEPAEAS